MSSYPLLQPRTQSVVDTDLAEVTDSLLRHKLFAAQIDELNIPVSDVRDALDAEREEVLAAVAHQIAEVERLHRQQRQVEKRATPQTSRRGDPQEPAKPRHKSGWADSQAPSSRAADSSSTPQKVRVTEPWQRLESLAAKARGPLRGALTDELSTRLQRILNQVRDDQQSERDRYARTLAGVDARELRAKVEKRLFVKTTRLQELGELLARMPGGSVGIAGSRGSGKSTALENVEQILPTQDSRLVKTFKVDAPTEYVPREFLLHLLGRIASEWLNEEREGGKSPVEGGQRTEGIGRWAASGSMLLVLIGLVAGVWTVGSSLSSTPLDSPGAVWAVAVALTMPTVAASFGLVIAHRLTDTLRRRVLLEGVTSRASDTVLDVKPSARARLAIVVAVVFLAVAADAVLLLNLYVFSPQWGGTRISALLLALAGAVAVVVYVVTLDLKLVNNAPLGSAMLSTSIVSAAAALGLPGALRLAVDWYSLDSQLVVGSALLSAAGCGVAMRLALPPGGSLPPGTPTAPRAVDLAHQAYQRVKFQSSTSAGTSTAVKLGASSYVPLGVDTSRTRTDTRAETPFTTPEIVEEIIGLLGAIRHDLLSRDGTPQDGVMILVEIDELDKLEGDAGARDFLNEIKGVFCVPGVIFLVSVSEDALASFERRGLAFRDAFDSAFDEIIYLPQLSLAETTDCLKPKVVPALPPPYVALAHCLSGGLARDIVRSVDRMVQAVERDPSLELGQVADKVVHRELRGKWQAVLSALRPLPLEPHVTTVLAVLYRLDSCPDGGVVRGRCLRRATAFDELMGVGLLPVKESDLPHLRTLLRLAGEYVGFCYFSLTLMEFFDDTLHDRLNAFQRAETADPHERGGLNYLARARHNLGVNPRLAWEQVSYFRKEHRLHQVGFPDFLLSSGAERPDGPADVSSAPSGPTQPPFEGNGVPVGAAPGMRTSDLG